MAKDNGTGLSVVERTWLGAHMGTSLYISDNGGSPPFKTPPDLGVDVAEVLTQENLDKVRELRDKLFGLDKTTGPEKFGDDYETLKKQLDQQFNALQKLGVPLETLAQQAAEFAERDAQREKKLEEVRNLLAMQKEEFSQRTDVVYKVKRKRVPGTKEIPAKVLEGQFVGLKRAQSDSDEIIEFSAEHYKDRVAPLDPATKKLLDLVIQQLELVSKQLRDDDDIDLTPNELMAELWTPLVREGIISSDQCPAEYSRIMVLWKGASELYLKPCEAKAREPEDKTAGLQTMLQDLDEVLDIGADIAAIALSFVGGDDAIKILKLVRSCVHGGLQGTKKALAMEFDKAGNEIATILGDVIEHATGNENLAKLVKGAFTATLNGALMSKSLANREWEEAFGFLCDGLDGAFVAIDKGDDGKAQEIGNHVIQAMKQAKGAGKIVYLFTQDPVDTGAVLAEMGGMVREGIAYGVKTYKLEKDKQKEEEALDDQNLSEEELETKKEEIASKYESLGESVDEITKTLQDEEDGGMIEGLNDVLGFSKDEEIDEERVMQDILRRTESKAIEDFAKQEETFERRIAIAFGVGAGADDEQMKMIEDLYDIDVLIGEIEAARAKLQLLKTILDAVSGVLTMLVPQLGGPLKARQFAFDCVQAVRRSQELIKFRGLVGDAQRSTSPQVHTLIAQVDELSHQLTNDVIEAAFHLVEACVTTAAAACELSGQAAPAGEALKIVEMGVEALHKSKEFVYKKFKEAKVRRAWNQFRRAIDNPADRRAIMKAFRSNPTLAKYGVAYGALEMGDPIAKEALRQCGLNDMTLANENTNAEKVVRYLEVKYADDIQVVGVLSKFAPDTGDPLSMQVWVKNKEAAVASGWQREKTTRIDVALVKVKNSSDRIDGLKKTIGTATAQELDDYWEVFHADLLALADGLRAYQPKTTDGKPFARFVTYVNELADAAGQRARELREEIAMRKKASEREEAGQKRLVEEGNKMKANIVAAQQALEKCRPADEDTTGELAAAMIADYFKTGEGLKLLTEVKALTKTSMLLASHVELFVKTVDLAVKKSSKDPVQVAGHINETVQRLSLCASRVDAVISA